MTAFELELRPRKEGLWGQHEFFLFAALCANFGVTKFIDHVLCCHNAGALVIELKPEAQLHPDAVGAIAYAALQTLDCFVLDGEHGWKERVE